MYWGDGSKRLMAIVYVGGFTTALGLILGFSTKFNGIFTFTPHP